MPLLLRRRSVLDTLNANAAKDDLPPPGPFGNALGLDGQPGSPTRPVSECGPPTSRLSHELHPDDVVPDDISVPETRREKRFSLLKLRNFSESHLGARAKADALRQHRLEEGSRPPVPVIPNSDVVPAIVRTAPTYDEQQEEREEEAERRVRPSLFKRSMSKGRTNEQKTEQTSPRQSRKSSEQSRVDKSKGSSLKWRRLQGRSTGLEDLARLSAMHLQQQNLHSAPPSYGDVSNSALALPVPDPRFSESSQSDGSNGSSGDQIYGQTTTTTHTVSTHTTFFKLPRRNQNRNSLFPLPVKVSPPEQEDTDEPSTPRASTYSTRSMQTPDSGSGKSPPGTALQRRHTEVSPGKQRAQHPSLPHTHAGLAKSSLSFAEPGDANLFRNDSQRTQHSATSSPLQPPMKLGLRDRASTTSSFGRGSQEMDTPPPLPGSGRNSTSTTGRSSLGGFLSFARFRQSSEPHSPRHGSPGTRSKSNSFAISREVLVIPEREEGDTPGKYLERLENAMARSMIAGILSKSADPFAQAVLRSYTRRFPFFGEPIDMSLRKFLLEAELPKETQQVDRVIQAFADRYHECNPGIFVSPDHAYIIAFSLMMLHTDAFNKNNKRKMQKQDYIKNTSGQHVADDVLACFYDNICYTPFVHYEEEVDINGERVMPFKPKKSKLKAGMTEAAGKKPSGPVDPYNLLVEQKLDMLRPNVKDSITFEDPYNYRGGQSELDPQYLQRAFTHTGILQIISARSRPTAYEGQAGGNIPNPSETQAGIIDLKITKVGTLWRKATKKKKARSPWQEWGAILTGSQLYLFKNAHWAKGLVHQFTVAQKHGQPRTPVIFKPPLSEFKPDALIKTDNAVALVDATYNRHKHAFTFFRAGGQEEVLLADNESERNDWLALINYAAAFRAAGVRIRGMVGGNEEDLRRRDVTRMESGHSTRSLQSATGEVVVMRGALSLQDQRQVMAARRQIMVQKIVEIEKEITEAEKQLDSMLRNARHLLILAPIAPKTREDVIHAAAKADAMIKWLRRDTWRMRCHKDILAMDVHQDGVSASELQTLTAQQAAVSESTRKEKPSLLQRLSSRAGAVVAHSPPRSPTSPTRSTRSERPSTKESAKPFMSHDVFRTPPESLMETQGDMWRLPPLQLDVQQRSPEDPRASVSTHLSVSSPRRGTLSHMSSASSVQQLERLDSPKSSEVESQKEHRTPRHSIESREAELLARSTMPPETIGSRGLGLDGAGPTSSPESKHKGVRRSLQKTLRDAQHHSNSVHRHKRNKDSEGTVRSGGAEADEQPEGTPGLQRETGRFILHGKQASVVQFGADWPNERMNMRREKWRQNSQGSAGAEHWDRRGSSAITDTPSTTRERRVGADEERLGSADSNDTANFREDAEAAAAFANNSASPVQMSSSASENGASDGEGIPPFDLSQWDPSTGKRETVIGPLPPRHRTTGSLSKGENGTVELESDTDDFSLGQRENRRTVIGPSIRINSGNMASPSSKGHLNDLTSPIMEGGAEREPEDESEEGTGDLEDDSMIAAPIDDEELRRINQQVVVG
jgi:hypothetical protein